VSAVVVAHSDKDLAFEFSSQPPVFGVLHRTVESAQFTAQAFTRVLREAEVRISMEAGAAGWTTFSSSACDGR
jgi:hypothetical protein